MLLLIHEYNGICLILSPVAYVLMGLLLTVAAVTCNVLVLLGQERLVMYLMQGAALYSDFY